MPWYNAKGILWFHPRYSVNNTSNCLKCTGKVHNVRTNIHLHFQHKKNHHGCAAQGVWLLVILWVHNQSTGLHCRLLPQEVWAVVSVADDSQSKSITSGSGSQDKRRESFYLNKPKVDIQPATWCSPWHQWTATSWGRTSYESQVETSLQLSTEFDQSAATGHWGLLSRKDVWAFWSCDSPHNILRRASAPNPTVTGARKASK